MGGEKRRQKSLRNGVHHADAVVRGPVRRDSYLIVLPPAAVVLTAAARDLRGSIRGMVVLAEDVVRHVRVVQRGAEAPVVRVRDEREPEPAGR